MFEGTLAAFAGLGFFLAGLHMLSEAVRALAARRMRLALARVSRLPFGNALAGSMLGAVTQSTSASAFICIGLLNARAVSFFAALSISAWASVGTSILVFLASVDLRSLALLALSVVGLLYLASLHRGEAGRHLTDLLLAIGVTLFGLTMLKATGHTLAESSWVTEFFTFASESWIYSFIIAFIVTLLMQSSSTVSALAVMLSATGVVPLEAAMVMVCGANAGSGVSVALISSHLSGPPRQLALWQAVVKLIGALVVLPFAVTMPEDGTLATLLPVPLFLSVVYLVINLIGAILSGLLRSPLLRLLERMAPANRELQRFEPEFILDEAAEDPGTAFILARREQAKLISLLPAALGPVRHGEPEEDAGLDNGARRELALSLTGDISDFVSEAVSRHPIGTEVTALLLLQRCNEHISSIIDALHGYVREISYLTVMTEREQTMCESMTESLHLLLGLAADEAEGDLSNHAMLERLTADRSETMTRFRQQIVEQDQQSHANREPLFVATGLFERMVWLVRQLSVDLSEISAAS
ncbi:MAG: Na/Pi symporter [Aestuariivirga sp.]|uniref:Na/Pi symporter n=1 Tax=Aestuariivirga sp. TaxID=2650926 RepID=UPI003015A287